MAKYNPEEYEPVDERLKRAFTDHPEMTVTTDIISPMEDVNEWVIIKATIGWVGTVDELIYTGIAHEVFDRGFVNKTSHVENCETSAIGRALANAGYSGSKRPSREEMEKVQRSEAGKSQAAFFKDKEVKARRKANDLLISLEGHSPDTAAEFREQLSKAKGYEDVVVIGKEIRTAIESVEPVRKSKKELANGMTDEQAEIF